LKRRAFDKSASSAGPWLHARSVKTNPPGVPIRSCAFGPLRPQHRPFMLGQPPPMGCRHSRTAPAGTISQASNFFRPEPPGWRARQQAPYALAPRQHAPRSRPIVGEATTVLTAGSNLSAVLLLFHHRGRLRLFVALRRQQKKKKNVFRDLAKVSRLVLYLLAIRRLFPGLPAAARRSG